MMRVCGKAALTLGALLLFVGSLAKAQNPGDPGGLGGGPILLMVPNVQEELNLSKDQTQTLPPTILQIVRKAREEMAGIRDLPLQERVNRQRALTRAMNDDAKKALSLSTDQARRFDQISLQQRGIEAFAEPEVQAKLALTDEQRTKIRMISENARGRIEEIAKTTGTDRAAMAVKIRQLQKDLMTEAQAELTDTQKASWKELAGEPFEVRFERPRLN